MSGEHILLLIPDAQVGQMLERAVLAPAGYRVTYTSQRKTAWVILSGDPPAAVILGDILEGSPSTDIGETLFRDYPLLPVILLPEVHSDSLAWQAFRQGFSEYLQPPIRPAEVQAAVKRVLERRKRLLEQIEATASKNTRQLHSRVNELEAIQQIGQKVTAQLDLDLVLTAVVDASVELTSAEEGSLLLLDETTGELYMRASRNFQEEFVKTFRLPIRDTLAGQVLKTGRPLLIDADTPQKIKTAYLVHTLIYVPLITQNRVIGVLEVDNRQSRKPFSAEQIKLLSALADYAAIAVENARSYSHSQIEREKLEMILTGMEEGVIIVDSDRRLVLINPKACEAFGITGPATTGMRLREVVNHQELLDLVREAPQTAPSRAELTLENGRVLNAQLTPLSQIGMVITMQDITHLKELDRIKSDFVHTVSHDLRSPLTAILGYVELIDRVGQVNEQQKEFIRRIQISVHNITSLINDLLELGRIQAGFDTRNEIVAFSPIVQFAVEGLLSRAHEKSQTIRLEIPLDLPSVIGNPVRLRQMLSNLVANAIKYTSEGGQVTVSGRAEAGQVILAVSDNGPGIPPSDQPYIFDKFYRASNAPPDSPGTGLGLAIVKSIVENHMGRVWVESILGQGTTFTIVLPTADREL